LHQHIVSLLIFLFQHGTGSRGSPCSHIMSVVVAQPYSGHRSGQISNRGGHSSSTRRSGPVVSGTSRSTCRDTVRNVPGHVCDRNILLACV